MNLKSLNLTMLVDFYELTMAHGYFDGHILYRRIEPILMSKKNAEQYYSNTYSVLEQMNKKSTK